MDVRQDLAMDPIHPAGKNEHAFKLKRPLKQENANVVDFHVL